MRVAAAVLLLYCSASFSAGTDNLPKTKAASTGSSVIIKCTRDGKTTYTNSHCESGETREKIEIQPPIGVVGPSREVIDETLERMRTERLRQQETSSSTAGRSATLAPAAASDSSTVSAGTEYPYPVIIHPNPCTSGFGANANNAKHKTSCASGWRNADHRHRPSNQPPISHRPHGQSGDARLNAN